MIEVHRMTCMFKCITELTAAYNRVRDDYSMQQYGKKYTELDPQRDKDKIKEVKKKYPRKLSEAEPVSIGAQ